jgi:hypothetical protein
MCTLRSRRPARIAGLLLAMCLAVGSAPAGAPATGGPQPPEIRIVREHGNVRVVVRGRVDARPNVTIAPEKAPFEFADTGELAITPDDLGKGVPVEVVNNRTTGRSLRVALSGLALVGIDGMPLPAADRAGIEPRRRLSLPASGAATIRLGPKQLKLQPGTYPGRLTVSNRATDTVIRRALALSVPGPAAALDPTPAAKELKIGVTRWVPWAESGQILKGNELPLDVPAGTTADGLAPAEDAVLGYVTGRGGAAAITWSKETAAVADGKGTVAKLGVASLESSEDFSGTIDLLPDDPDAGEVAVEVTATDSILWAAAALLAGILTALAIKRWINVGRVAAGFGERLTDAVRTFRRAEAEVAKDHAGQPYGAYTVSQPFYNEANALKNEIDELRTSLWLDSGKHDDITARLGKLRGVADTWKRFGDALPTLAESVARLPIDDEGKWPGVRESTSPLLQGGPLASFADYDNTRLKVNEATMLLVSWHALHDQLVAAQKLAEQIKQKNPTGVKKARLEAANAKLDGVRHTLWTAKDADALSDLNAETNLNQAQQALAELTGLLKLPPPHGAEWHPATSGGAGSVAAAVAATNPVQAPEVAQIDWEAEAKRFRKHRLSGDLLVAGFAAIAGLITGLNELYFGDTFGGLDYVAALLWGFGAETALAGLVAALDRLGAPPGTAAQRATLPQLAGAADGNAA